LEIRPVILSESEGSLRPASQILRCAQDDRQNASSPLNGKPYLQMSEKNADGITLLYAEMSPLSSWKWACASIYKVKKTELL